MLSRQHAQKVPNDHMLVEDCPVPNTDNTPHHDQEQKEGSLHFLLRNGNRDCGYLAGESAEI